MSVEPKNQANATFSLLTQMRILTAGHDDVLKVVDSDVFEFCSQNASLMIILNDLNVKTLKFEFCYIHQFYKKWDHSLTLPLMYLSFTDASLSASPFVVTLAVQARRFYVNRGLLAVHNDSKFGRGFVGKNLEGLDLIFCKI